MTTYRMKRRLYPILGLVILAVVSLACGGSTTERLSDAEPTPTETPTTMLSVAQPVANSNANLRSGPGTNYDVTDGVTQGQTLEIAGRNAAGDWYALANDAWIAAFLVDNAPPNLDVVDALPPTVMPILPTPTSVPATATAVSTSAAPTATPTVAQATANADANLRSGPGTQYDISGGVAQNETFDIVGRNADGDWYMLAGGMWIAAFLVDNAPVNVSVVEASAPPIATPVPPTAVPQQPSAPSFPPPPAWANVNCEIFGEAQLCAGVSNSSPAQNASVVVYGRLYQNGLPVSGQEMSTSWNYKSTVSGCGGSTGGDGVAQCDRRIGRATIGYTVRIDVTINGHRVNTSFTP